MTVYLVVSLVQKARVLLIFRGLPSLLCLVYLSISIPIRVVIAFRKGRYFYWDDDFHETNTMEDIQASYSGLHVKKLFEKPILEQYVILLKDSSVKHILHTPQPHPNIALSSATQT